METKTNGQLNETIYRKTLDNGLKVAILPKKDFHQSNAILTVDYGASDIDILPFEHDDFIEQPLGIAHFLEHQLFTQKDGSDALTVFSQYGSDANAFTSFTQTSYLFETTNYFKECLMHLLDFVQAPYFTQDSVEKEKGIITQEIKMYQDNPENRLFYGILNNLYPNTPIRNEIAGTPESIQKITVDDLYLAYNTFYQPSNMTLFITGNVDPEETVSWVESNQQAKEFKSFEIKRHAIQSDKTGEDILPYGILEMPVQRAKSIVGVKGVNSFEGLLDAQRFQIHMSMLIELILGESSHTYNRLYDSGKIDDTFGLEVISNRAFHSLLVSGETDNPQDFNDQVIDTLLNWESNEDFNAENVERLKNATIGHYIRSFDSLSSLTNQFSDQNYLAIYEILQRTDMDSLRATAHQYLNSDFISTFQIVPVEEKA